MIGQFLQLGQIIHRPRDAAANVAATVCPENLRAGVVIILCVRALFSAVPQHNLHTEV